MNKEFRTPSLFKALIYLFFSLMVIINYSNFKGHPADWTPFTFLFGLIEYLVLILFSGLALYFILRKNDLIINWCINSFNVTKPISLTLISLFIYLPFLLSTNYIFNYSDKPDLTTNSGKLKWELEWISKNDDRVKTRNKGLAQNLPNGAKTKYLEEKLCTTIINQLNYALEFSPRTNYKLLSSIFDSRIDSLTSTENYEHYKSSVQAKAIQFSPNSLNYWGLISFKNNPKNWTDSTRKNLYEDTWFISIENDSISNKVLFFSSQYSAKSYCIERDNSNHYSLNNIQLMDIPNFKEFEKEISPISPLFWESKPFEVTQWNNLTIRNIELDCVSSDSCFIRPYLSLIK